MSTQTPALPGLGETLYGPTSTIDTSDYGSSVTLEGSRAVFDFVDYTDKTKKDNRKISAIFVRNLSGITLYAKRAVTWSLVAGKRGRRVIGYSHTTGMEIAGIVDDRLGSNGVRNGDMFWVMVKGPALILTPLADLANDLAPGDILLALTAVTSQSTTAGRFQVDDGTFAQTETTETITGMAAQMRNAFGVAVTASLTDNTNSGVEIDLCVLRSPGG